MSSWHFLLILMTTDSVIFHWIWTGIHVDNQLWVIRDPLFYLRPVLSLLWLHLSLWLLLLPAHDHLCYQPLMAVLALGRMVSFIRIGHSFILIQWVSFGLLLITVILLMLHSTPFALWTSPQWNRICEWSVIVLSTTNKRIISLSLTCQRNTTCNLCCFQTTLKLHLPAHSLCFLDTIIQPNQHHSPEYPKPSCIDIIIISPICNWNPMAQSSSSYQHSPFAPVPYDQQPTHSNTLHSQPSKHTPTASILASLCNPWFQ